VVEELSLYCNRDFAVLESLLDNLSQLLLVVGDAANQTLGLVSCDRIVPIYTRTVYNATCDYSINAVSWIFSCSLILGFFGMLMITFRSAYKLTLYDDSETQDLLLEEESFDGRPGHARNDVAYPYDVYATGSGEHFVHEVQVDANGSAIEVKDVNGASAHLEYKRAEASTYGFDGASAPLEYRTQESEMWESEQARKAEKKARKAERKWANKEKTEGGIVQID
jgi:hypothetical protein